MKLESLVASAFDTRTENPLSETHALVVSVDGTVVAEHYAEGFDAASTFISWSTAKSVAAALCGHLIGQGRLELDAPAPVAAWSAEGDPRASITLRHLLAMRSGLEWNEDYVDDTVSDVIEMLFGSGKPDVAAHASSKRLAAEPGAVFNYSSGTTNIVTRLCADIIGGGVEGFEAVLLDELLRPAGMRSVTVKHDDAGTWVGSSFLYATARDYLAFGELCRNDGVVDGERLLPAGWTDVCTRTQAVDADSGQGYGLHWWTTEGPPFSYAASGYEGQRIQVTPDLGLTFVRLGKTPEERNPQLRSFYAQIVAAVAGGGV